MSKDLFDIADQVETETDFLQFIEALASDREDKEEKASRNQGSHWTSGANGWENGKISTFLEAACAWGKASINGTEYYSKPENQWKRAAQILHAGKFYE